MSLPKRKFGVLLCLGTFAFTAAVAAKAQGRPEWTQSFPPFRIAGNLYYVGSRDLASYLVVTPKGNILINSNLQSSVPQIQASIRKLGFKFTDIKILLISHAHYDHCAGSAAILKRTPAKYMVMDADVPVVESGGRDDFNYANQPGMYFPRTHVDRVLHDGEEVTLGGTTLTAHLTPGHTKGCTTWTMKVKDGGSEYNVVIVGSPNVNPGYKLVNNSRYPQIATDFERTFRVLAALPCDIFLGAHGSYFGMIGKFERRKAGSMNPFIDPAGYHRFVEEHKKAFRRELEKQQAASK